MLRTIINKNEIKSSLEPLVLTGNCTYQTGGTLTIPTTNLNVRTGDNIRITRKDGRQIDYDITCSVISNINGLITVGYDFIRSITPNKVSKVTDIYVPMQGNSNFLALSFNVHYYRKNRDNVVISNTLPSGYTFGTASTQCLDYKHFMFNDRYLYKSKDKDANGNFILTLPNFENYKDITFTYQTGNTLTGGFVPLNGVVDDTTLVYFPWNDAYQTYVDNNTLFEYTDYDPRFFSLNSGGTLTERDGVTIYREINSSLSIGLGQLFTPDISIEEDVKDNYLQGRIGKNINPIIDYEKKMFEPVYLTQYTTGNTINALDVDKITFNLYFRKRNYTDSDWYLNGSSGWCRDDYGTAVTMPSDIKFGDPLGTIGFTDNDIFNRNKRFAKSFIRLSFFDSPDKKKQVLQFYSTIFFDTTTMYNRFMKNKGKYVMGADEQYVDRIETNDESYSLSTTFTCSGNRDSQTSSEGFYLYLFDNIIEGTKPTPLYMLVEFNHAKYGKTIPMMMPTRLTNAGLTPIDYTDAAYFPKGYIKSSSTRFYADMSQFYQDLFIKVYVKYDQASGRYVWYFPRKGNSKNIVLNLFEPQINQRPQL